MKILDALKNREWIPYAYDWKNNQILLGCTTCSQEKKNGHAPDCKYAAAIREAERIDGKVKCPTCGNDWLTGRIADCEDEFHAEINKQSKCDIGGDSRDAEIARQVVRIAELKKLSYIAMQDYAKEKSRAEKAEADVERSIVDIKRLVAKNDDLLANERRIIDKLTTSYSTIDTLREALEYIYSDDELTGRMQTKDELKMRIRICNYVRKALEQTKGTPC